MNIKTLSICLGMIACMMSAAMADVAITSTTAPTINKKPISVSVGQTFNIRLAAGEDCGKIRPDAQAGLDSISLLVNGVDSGLHPMDCDPATNELAFVLNKNEATDTPAVQAAWHILFGHPLMTANSQFKREVRYTVRQPAQTSALQNLGSGTLQLTLVKPGVALMGCVLALSLWIGLLFLGHSSGMLRDAGTGKALESRTFSLARVQMAWWFGIIMGAYIFLWVLTENFPPLSSQALLLMGISGATGLVSAGMDANRQSQHLFVKGEFLEDLLSDADGVTLHRFQMLATTVILGALFVVHVATTLSMPEFDASLLALMGITSGTYLGFKFPEKHMASTATSVEAHKSGYTPEP